MLFRKTIRSRNCPKFARPLLGVETLESRSLPGDLLLGTLLGPSWLLPGTTPGDELAEVTTERPQGLQLLADIPPQPTADRPGPHLGSEPTDSGAHSFAATTAPLMVSWEPPAVAPGVGGDTVRFLPAAPFVGSGSPVPPATAPVAGADSWRNAARTPEDRGGEEKDLDEEHENNGHHNRELAFREPVEVAAGTNPKSVTAADFDGDHRLDVAVANNGSNNVSILRGDGHGSFTPAPTLAAGTAPFFITHADLNHDGTEDLLTTGGGKVSVLLGQGDGTFAPAASFTVGADPRSVVVADFNGDGNADLAVANFGANSVSVLAGHGDGTFAAATTVLTAVRPTFVTSGDFDGDGRPDLAVAVVGTNALGPGSESILLGNGDGSFRAGQQLTVGVFPWDSVGGDFNGDGRADLAVGDFNSDEVSILLGTGAGQFAVAHTYAVSANPFSLATGDFNGDGVTDIVAASGYAVVSVLEGHGDGSFEPTHDYWAGSRADSGAVGDFDRDGRPDLVVSHFDTNAAAVIFNDGLQKGDGVTIIRDISYVAGPDPAPQRHLLDLYLPAHQHHHHFPVVMLVFGGGGTNGQKSRLGYLARTLAREGYGVVTPNYRLTDGTPQSVGPGVPKVQDLAKAFAWTYRNIADYKGDPDRIALVGHSSGGGYVTALAMNPNFLQAEGLSRDLIRGVVDFSGGPYVSDDPELSPIDHVGPSQPPFSILYTDRDTALIQTQSVQFYNALVAAGSEAELHPFSGPTHPGLVAGAAHDGPARDLLLEFLAAHTG
jgi:acetyl esterase/lipase